MFLLFGIASIFGSVFAFINCLDSDWSIESIVIFASCLTSLFLYIKLASMDETLKSLKKEAEEQRESFEHFKLINKENLHTLQTEINTLTPDTANETENQTKEN